MIQFYICVQPTLEDPITIIDCFENLDPAIDCLEELQRILPDQNFWIGSVPYKVPDDTIPDPLIL